MIGINGQNIGKKIDFTNIFNIFRTHLSFFPWPFSKAASHVSLWEDLNISIERALDISPNIILLGDFNENLLNENLTHLKTILVNSLRNVITTPTRITAHSSTLLDPIIISTLNFTNLDVMI